MRTLTAMMTAILISSGAHTASASTQTCGDALLSMSGGALYTALGVSPLQGRHLQTIRKETSDYRQWLERELARVRRELHRSSYDRLHPTRQRQLRQQEASLIRQLEQQPARAAARAAALLTPGQRARCAQPQLAARLRSLRPGPRVERSAVVPPPPRRRIVRAPQPVTQRTPPARVVRDAPPRSRGKVTATHAAPIAPRSASTRRAPASGPTTGTANEAPAQRPGQQVPRRGNAHSGRRS